MIYSLVDRLPKVWGLEFLACRIHKSSCNSTRNLHKEGKKALTRKHKKWLENCSKETITMKTCMNYLPLAKTKCWTKQQFKRNVYYSSQFTKGCNLSWHGSHGYCSIMWLVTLHIPSGDREHKSWHSPSLIYFIQSRTIGDIYPHLRAVFPSSLQKVKPF